MTCEEQDLTAKIGLRIRVARKAQKLSLPELSVLTGSRLSGSRIGNYEHGLRCLEIEEAQVLAEALGTVSAALLLCLEDKREPLRGFRACDEQRRRTFLAVAEAQEVQPYVRSSQSLRFAPTPTSHRKLVDATGRRPCTPPCGDPPASTSTPAMPPLGARPL